MPTYSHFSLSLENLPSHSPRNTSLSRIIADGVELTTDLSWTVMSLSEEFRIGAQGQESVTCLWGFGLKVHVELEPNLAPLLANPTSKSRDLVRQGTHEQAGILFCRGWENGMDTVRGVETRNKDPMRDGLLECI